MVDDRKTFFVEFDVGFRSGEARVERISCLTDILEFAFRTCNEVNDPSRFASYFTGDGEGISGSCTGEFFGYIDVGANRASTSVTFSASGFCVLFNGRYFGRDQQVACVAWSTEGDDRRGCENLLKSLIILENVEVPVDDWSDIVESWIIGYD